MPNPLDEYLGLSPEPIQSQTYNPLDEYLGIIPEQKQVQTMNPLDEYLGIGQEPTTPQPIRGLAGQPTEPQLQWTPPGQPLQRPPIKATEIVQPMMEKMEIQAEKTRKELGTTGDLINRFLNMTVAFASPNVWERKKSYMDWVAEIDLDTPTLDKIALTILVTMGVAEGTKAAINWTKFSRAAKKFTPEYEKAVRHGFAVEKSLERLHRNAPKILANPERVAKLSDREISALYDELPSARIRQEFAKKYPAIKRAAESIRGAGQVSPEVTPKPPITRPPEVPKPIIKPTEPTKISIPERPETFIRAGEQLARDFTALEKVAPSAAKILGTTKVSKIMMKVDPVIEQKRLFRLQENISKLGYKEGYKVGSEKYNQKLAEYKELQQRIQAEKQIKDDVLRMAKRIKNINTDNLPIEYKSKIDEMRNKFDLNFQSNRTLFRRDSMRQFIEREKESGNEILIPKERLDLLDKTPLNEMFIGQVQELYNTITELAHMGRTKNKLLSIQQHRTLDNLADEGSKLITMGKGVKEITPAEKTAIKASKKWLEKLIDKAKHYHETHVPTQMLVEAMDNYEYGINNRVLWEAWRKGEDTENILFEQITPKIHEILEETTFKKMVEKYDIAGFKKVPLDWAMDIYLHTKHPYNRTILTESNKFTEKQLKEITEWLEKNAPEEKRAFDRIIDEIMPLRHEGLSKIHMVMRGVPLGKVEPYWSTTMREDVGIADSMADEIETMKSYMQPTASIAEIKKRVSTKPPFKEFSAMKRLANYITNSIHYESWAMPIRDTNRYLKHPKIKEALDQEFSSSFRGMLDKQLKEIGHGMDLTDKNSVERVGSFIRNNLFTFWLGININSGIRATFSFPAAVSQIGESWAARGVAHVMANPIESLNQANKESTFMRNRGFNIDRETKKLMSRRDMQTLLFGTKSPSKLTKELVMAHIRFSDKATVLNAYWGGKIKVLSTGTRLDGKTKVRSDENLETVAIQEAENNATKSQPMGGILHLPETHRGGVWAKSITMFTNYLQRNYALVAKEFAKTYRGKYKGEGFYGSYREKINAVNRLFWLTVVPGYLMASLAKKTLFPSKKEVAKAATRQVTGGLFLINLLHKEYPGSYGTLAAFTEEISKIGQKDLIGQIVAGGKLGLAAGYGIPKKMLFMGGKPFTMGGAARIMRKERRSR